MTFTRFTSTLWAFAPKLIVALRYGATLLPYIPQIVELIQEAEAIPAATGNDKKNHVLAVLRTTLELANQTNKVNVNVEEIVSAASQAIDVVIGVVNLIGKN